MKNYKEYVFKDLAEFVNGRAFKPTEWKKEGLPIIRIQNLNEPNKPYNFYDGEVDKKYYVEKGDLLISWSASLGVFIWNADKAILNQHIFKVNVNKDIIDKKFFFYATKTKLNEMKSRVHGSTMKHITKKDFEKIKLLVPPLLIQKEIVSTLEKAENLKQRRIRTNEDMNKVLQSIFSEMFGDPIKNKKGYNIKTIKEVCDKITDGTHKTPEYTEEGVPFLRVTDLTESNSTKKFISKEEHKELIKRCKPEKNDVLYTKNGTIGIAKVVDWDYEFSIFVSLCLLKPNKNLIRPRYLEAFLNTPFALHQAKAHSKKGTITNLHLIEIKKIKIPLPSLKEQDLFIKKVKQVNKIKEKQKKSTEEINQLFDALMQKAFKGELVQ